MLLAERVKELELKLIPLLDKVEILNALIDNSEKAKIKYENRGWYLEEEDW